MWHGGVSLVNHATTITEYPDGGKRGALTMVMVWAIILPIGNEGRPLRGTRTRVMVNENESKPSGIHRRGFASMNPSRLKEVSAAGGKATKREQRPFFADRELAKTAGKLGGRTRRV
jgi:general stress protein YciG